MSEHAIAQVKPQSLQAKLTPVSHGILQRCSNGVECEECRKKREGTLQRAAINAAPTNSVPPIVHDVLHSSGQPLDTGTQAFMEPRFSHDFSGVRVHSDERAAESARAVNALAYTVGRDVVFGAEQYAPTTMAGKKLLAHELTHVVQQKRSIPQQHNFQQQPITHLSQEGDTEEVEARRVANEVTLGQRTTISAFPLKNTLSLMRQSPPLPGIPELPSRLSDVQLKQRSDQIYEQAVSAHLNQEGKPITKEMLGMLKKELTVGVLQGVKDGKLVTMVNGHNPDFADFVKASLKSGEEYIESIEAIPENVRTGEPRKSGQVYVHAEQVLASEAKVQGVSDARVGTSNNGCNELCMSNLSENYPEVFHVNPAKPRKATTPVGSAPTSKKTSHEAKEVESPQTEKVAGKSSTETVPKPPVEGPKPSTGSSVETPVTGTNPQEEVTVKPPGGGVKAPENAVPEVLPPQGGSVGAGKKPSTTVPEEAGVVLVPKASMGREVLQSVGETGFMIALSVLQSWLMSKLNESLYQGEKQRMEIEIRNRLDALGDKAADMQSEAPSMPIFANITIKAVEFHHHETMDAPVIVDYTLFGYMSLESVDISHQKIESSPSKSSLWDFWHTLEIIDVIKPYSVQLPPLSRDQLRRFILARIAKLEEGVSASTSTQEGLQSSNKERDALNERLRNLDRP